MTKKGTEVVGTRARTALRTATRGAFLVLVVSAVFGFDAASSGAVPSLKVPTVTVPTITVPKVTTPIVTVPSVHTPSVSTGGSSGGGSRGGGGSSAGLSGVGGIVGAGSAPRYTPQYSAASSDTGSGSASNSGSGSGSSSGKQTAAQRQASQQRAASRERYLKQLVSRYQGCLGELSPQAERTLILRTGEGGGRAYSPAQVARKLGVSQSRERAIEQSAVTQLRDDGRSGACSSATGIGQAVSGTLVSLVTFTGGAAGTGGSAPLVASTTGASSSGSGAGAGSGSGSGSSSSQTGSGTGGSNNPTINYATLHPPTSSGGGFPLLLVLVLMGVAALAVLAFGPEWANRRRMRVAAETTFAGATLYRPKAPPALAAPAAAEAETVPAEEHDEAAAYDGEVYDAEVVPDEQLPPAPADAQAQAPAPGQAPLPAVRSSEARPGWMHGHRRQALMMAASLSGAMRMFVRGRQRSKVRRKNSR